MYHPNASQATSQIDLTLSRYKLHMRPQHHGQIRDAYAPMTTSMHALTSVVLHQKADQRCRFQRPERANLCHTPLQISYQVVATLFLPQPITNQLSGCGDSFFCHTPLQISYQVVATLFCHTPLQISYAVLCHVTSRDQSINTSSTQTTKHTIKVKRQFRRHKQSKHGMTTPSRKRTYTIQTQSPNSQ